MKKLLVVIDPGHYKGYNPWTNGLYEGTEMFRMAQILKEELNSNGIDTLLTKTSAESNPGLYARGQVAVAQKSNYEIVVFLSLHDNAPGANGSSSIRGTVIFTSMYDKQLKFLQGLQNAVSSVIGCGNREISSRSYAEVNSKQDWYGVIRGAMNGATDQNQADTQGVWCAAIIEHDFHTNPTYCDWMKSDDNKRKVAKSEANYIANYFGVATSSPNTSTGLYTNQVCNGTLTIVYPHSDGVSLHNAPNLNANTIAKTAKFNERYRVVGISTLSTGTQLYRLEDGYFITSVPVYVSYKENGYPKFVGKVKSNDGLNVRDFPNVGGNKIFLLGNGNLIEVIGEAYNNGTKWYYIYIKNANTNLKGYVNASYIVKM